SKDYHPALKVFTLVVLTSGDRHKTDIAMTDFDPHDLSGNPLNEIPHKIIYLCPKYVNDATPEPYREWLLAINDTLDEEVDEKRYSRPEIHKLFDHIQKDRISPAERANMIEEYHQEELQRAQFDEGKLAVAKALLKEGIPPHIIAKTTGFPLDAIIGIKNRVVISDSNAS
ncbi:MAG: hypothetical protein WBM35_05825, partial [Candidatus Electrothrix sp.]